MIQVIKLGTTGGGCDEKMTIMDADTTEYRQSDLAKELYPTNKYYLSRYKYLMEIGCLHPMFYAAIILGLLHGIASIH